MPEVLQGGLLPEPWQGLLDSASNLPAKTLAEMVAGRMQIVKARLEAGEIVDVNEDPQLLFKLKDFMETNEYFREKLTEWGLPKLRAAAVRVDANTYRVNAITPAGSVIFDEPVEGFPSEELLTKLRMIG